MAQAYPIPDAVLDELLQNHEFPASIVASAPRVAVVLTQGWCPEWYDMAGWLKPDYEGAKVFQLIYDKHPRFNEIRTFKEKVFKSHAIPYVRYYRDGRLAAESFYVWEDEFLKLLTMENA